MIPKKCSLGEQTPRLSNTGGAKYIGELFLKSEHRRWSVRSTCRYLTDVWTINQRKAEIAAGVCGGGRTPKGWGRHETA